MTAQKLGSTSGAPARAIQDTWVDDINANTSAVAAKANASALTTEFSARDAGDIGTAFAANRPGESPHLFATSIAGGDPAALPQIPGGMIVVGTNAGKAVRVVGGGDVAQRGFFPLEPGRRSNLRAQIRRRGNSADPSGDAVQFCVAWYDIAKTPLASPHDVTVIQTLSNPLVSDNLQSLSGAVADTASSGVLAWPTGAAYGKALTRTFGNTPITDTETIERIDATNLSTYSPDLTTLTGEVTALTSANLAARTGDLETAVGTPNVKTFDTHANFIAATINSSVDIVVTLGWTTKGDLGGRTTKRAASEPAHLGRDQSADGAWWEVIDPQVRLEQFGPVDTTSHTASALAACSSYRTATGAALLIDRPYALPTSGGPFSIGPAPVICAANASLSGQIYLDQSVRVVGRLPVSYDDGTAHYNYVLGGEFGRAAEQRELPLNGSVIDDRLLFEAIDLTAMEHSKWPSTSSDTWTTESPSAVAGDLVTYAITNDSNWHVTWVPVLGAMEVSGFLKGASLTRGVFLRTTEGMEYFYAAPSSTGIYAYKLSGADPVTASGQEWLGRADHLSYQSQNSEWTLRAVTPHKWAMLLNGVEVLLPRALNVIGEIVSIGFGFYGNAALTGYVAQITRVTRREQTGGTGIHLGIVGNSISDPATHGSLQKWIEEYLDGACGLRILGTTNLAVSGYNSLDIYNSIAAGALGFSNVVAIIAPEANDVQESAAVSTTIANVTATINQIKSEARIPVLVIGYPWWSQALGSTYSGIATYGQATVNYEQGAEFRATLRRVAAALGGVYILDLQQVCGPMVAEILGGAIDGSLRDNIHPTGSFYRRQLAGAVAKAMLRALRPLMTPRVIRAPWPTSGGPYTWLRNSWTGSALAYSLSDEGRMNTHGLMISGTKTDGTLIFQLPKAYAPIAQERLMVATDSGYYATLIVDTDGTGKLYGFNVAGSFLSLDGLSWITVLAPR